jgi:hypothetical protein
MGAVGVDDVCFVRRLFGGRSSLGRNLLLGENRARNPPELNMVPTSSSSTSPPSRPCADEAAREMDRQACGAFNECAFPFREVQLMRDGTGILGEEWQNNLDDLLFNAENPWRRWSHDANGCNENTVAMKSTVIGI